MCATSCTILSNHSVSLLYQKNGRMKRDLGQPKERVKLAAAPSRQHAATKRPKRVAATSTRSYKEPDTDDSQPEEPEDPPATKAGDRLLFLKHCYCFVLFFLNG